MFRTLIAIEVTNKQLFEAFIYFTLQTNNLQKKRARLPQQSANARIKLLLE